MTTATTWNPTNERLAKYLNLANLDNRLSAKRLREQASKAQRKLNRLAYMQVSPRFTEGLRLYRDRANEKAGS